MCYVCGSSHKDRNLWSACALTCVSKENSSRAADARQRDSLIMPVGCEKRPTTPADPICQSGTSPLVTVMNLSGCKKVDQNVFWCEKHTLRQLFHSMRQLNEKSFHGQDWRQ